MLSGVAIALVLFGWVAYFRLVSQTSFVDHTYVYMDELRSSLLEVINAETGVRNYVLTSNPIFLHEYQAAANKLPANLRQLRATTLTSAGRQWFDRTLPLVDRRMDELTHVVQLKREGKSKEAWEFLRSNATLQTKLVVVGAFQGRHSEIYSELRSRLAEQNTDAALVVGASSLVSLFIVTLCALLWRSTRQALEAARLKSEFVANLSHEMRTPMYGILGTSELLENEKDPAEMRVLAGHLRTSAQSLMLSLNDIIDFVKLEAGNFRVDRQEFEPATLVKQVKVDLQPEASAKAIELEAFVHPDVPKTVNADKQKIERVLQSLVNNAVKFTERGRVRISVSMRAGTNIPTLHIAVIDTGVGVPPERRAAVILPFVQGDGSNTRRYGGLGLGLTIADRLVKLMGGEFGFVTKAGRGSAFWFDVPV